MLTGLFSLPTDRTSGPSAPSEDVVVQTGDSHFDLADGQFTARTSELTGGVNWGVKTEDLDRSAEDGASELNERSR